MSIFKNPLGGFNPKGKPGGQQGNSPGQGNPNNPTGNSNPSNPANPADDPLKAKQNVANNNPNQGQP